MIYCEVFKSLIRITWNINCRRAPVIIDVTIHSVRIDTFTTLAFAMKVLIGSFKSLPDIILVLYKIIFTKDGYTNLYHYCIPNLPSLDLKTVRCLSWDNRFREGIRSIHNPMAEAVCPQV